MFFFFWELCSFRLYPCALSCTYFLAHDIFILMYFFYELYMLGGDIMFLFLFLVSLCATLAFDLYYEVIHDICL